MKKYVLNYEVHLKDSNPLLNKQIKIDNCLSELHAKSRLEDYLKKKFINFDHLIVTQCTEDFMSNIFGNGNIFGDAFKDIFGR